jgi:hypothetical protein
LTTKTRGKSRRAEQSSLKRQLLARYFPAWMLLAVIFAMLLPKIIGWAADTAVDAVYAAPGAIVSGAETAIDIGGDVVSAIGNGIKDWLDDDPELVAPLFTAEVRYWQEDIQRWADEYDLDPNLLATVMQIESCGYESALSVSGAQGLFQVMPMHFDDDDNAFDPDTNARSSAGVLADCLNRAGGNTGLAMACYNGGPSVIGQPYNAWFDETQRYYTWGTGIYADAQDDKSSSDTLDEWLAAGGQNLCDLASATQ